jgi:hypothetical protein
MKWLFGLAAVCGLMAAGSHRMADEARERAGKVKAVPQEMTVAQLAANGPGDNLFVVLTDFRFRPSDVYRIKPTKRRQMRSPSDQYTRVYFPLEPRRKAAAAPGAKPLRVVVQADTRTDREVEAFMRQTRITGMIHVGVEQSYQKVEPVEWRAEGRQPEIVWFVHADERPERRDPNALEGSSSVMGLAAVAFLVAGTVAFARGRRRPTVEQAW